MTDWFHLPAPLDRPLVTLAGPEAHHLSHVLRLRPGARVTLFDGAGVLAEAEVVAVAKRDVTLRPLSVTTPSPPTAVPITLAVAPPKGDRFRWAVEKATELGVVRFVPLLARRGVVDPRDSKLDKLRQTVVAACKQCRRATLMALEEPTPLAALLDAAADQRRIVLHPGGAPLPALLAEAPGADLVLLIGPEGGFTDEELQSAADAGGRLASLGRTILRTETAAIAAAAVAAANC